MNTARVGSVVVGLQVLCAGVATSQPSMTTSKVERSHRGTNLRLYLGPSYFTPTGGSTEEVKVSGPGVAIGAAVGRALVPNVFVCGELLIAIAVAPSLSTLDGPRATSGDVAARVSGLGVGAAYYVMPANAYLAATLSLSQLTVVDGGLEIASDVAPGIAIAAGKEWWVSPRWGVGAAVQLFGVAGQSRGTRGGGFERQQRVQTVAVVLSASYDVASE